MLTTTSRIRSNPNIVYRDLEDGGVLLHLRSGQYHNVNSTGSAIWKALIGEPTVGQVVEAVQKALGDEPSDLEGDVSGFLESLIERDLVELVEET